MRTTSAGSHLISAPDRRPDPPAASGGGRLAAALTLVSLLWTALIVAAPAAATPTRSPLLSALTYHAGSFICHQRPDRSFHFDARRFAVCARCTGLYAGGALGLLLAVGLRRRWSTAGTRIALAVALMPIAATIALEWLGLLSTSNLARFATGFPAGLVAGIVINGMLLAPSPRTFWTGTVEDGPRSRFP
jgi:uncharacterized membrane protein